MDKTSAYNYIRSKFVGIRETKRLIKKYALKIKYGYLSDEESKTVKTVVNQFLLERKLTLDDLKKHLVEDTDFPIHDLLFECTSKCELRTYKSIHTHISYMYHPYIHIKWNDEEEIQLLDLVNQKGFKWKEISYHISKYKDVCRLKYLAIKGELNKNTLSKKAIEEILKNKPTEGEWEELCKQMKMNKIQILRLINKYLNGKELFKSENKILEIKLCLSILNNNHYCKFNINIESIIKFLNEEEDIYEKIDGKTTPFISKKGKRAGSFLVDGVYQRSNSNITGIDDNIDENVVRIIDDNIDDSRSDIVNITDIKPNQKNENDEIIEDDFETILKNIKKITKENKTQAKFLNKFLDFFKLDDSFDLNVEIRKEDIFWFNVCREVVLEQVSAVNKFNQMRVSYNWKVFQDIYDTVIKLGYDHVIKKIKEKLVNKAKNKGVNTDGDLISCDDAV